MNPTTNRAVYWDEHLLDEKLESCLGRIRRLKPVKGELSNERVFEVLYLHFIRGWSVESVAELVCPRKKDLTILNKIVASNSGKEACRRPDVRNIFCEYVRHLGRHEIIEAMGLGMTEEQQKAYLSKWLDNIVQDLRSKHCGQDIDSHIIKHFGDDFKKHLEHEAKTGSTDWDCWIASCKNLLEIFMRIREIKIETKDSLRRRIERLQVKYDNNPLTHTPPPKNW